MSGSEAAAGAARDEGPVLWLKRREDHRLRNGHPWVFSNEVDVGRSPLTALAPGDAVEVRAHSGRPLGMALASPRSLICARLYSARGGEPFDEAAIAARLEDALGLRERMFDRPHYRLVHAESDALPGLVVDRFGDVLVAQLGTAGMELRRGAILGALESVLRPRAIVLRNDSPGRAHEGLETAVEIALGDDPGMVAVEENGAAFEASPLSGQKTGWFFDHRANRAALARLAGGARVLDLFSYTGAWGVQAARAGAAAVLCVDSSRTALEQAARHAAANGVSGVVSTEAADAFEALRALANEGRRFDVVVLDPPAFVRRRKDLRSGEEAYQRLNRLALHLVEKGGLLVSASCSFHLPRARLVDLVRRAARSSSLRVQVVGQGHQDADHPILPGFPESEYLKAFTFRVTGDR